MFVALRLDFIECLRLDRQPDLYAERQSGNASRRCHDRHGLQQRF